MEDFKARFGTPTEKAHQLVGRIFGPAKTDEHIRDIMKKFSWYKGDKPL
jgi:hypothetical protein